MTVTVQSLIRGCDTFSLQTRKDLLQMMLNAHRDTDINDNEKVQSYEEDPDKWKKRGN